MKMKNKFLKIILIFFVFILFWFSQLYTLEGRGWYQLHKMLNSMEQLTVFDRVDIIFALQDELGERLPIDYQWKTNEIDGIRSLILSGFSFELPAAKIAKSCTILFDAYQNGAVHPDVLDFFDLLLASQITADKLALLSRISNDLQIFSDDERMELIAEFQNKNYPENSILRVVSFLNKAHAEKLDHHKVILTALVTLRKNDEKNLGVQLNSLFTELKNQRDNEFKILVYVSIAGNFKGQKIPDNFLDDLAVEAVNSGWNKKIFIQILEILNKTANENLQFEKLKNAITHRLVSSHQISEDFVKSVCEHEYEKMKEEVVLSRETNQFHQNLENTSNDNSNSSPEKEKVLNAINSYLGTPYHWGGTSYNGIDCSGLTQSVFWKCGVQIPRTSRQQYRRGKNVNFSDLSFGDLVFFSTNLFSRVNHVGIYIGNNKFCHASSSRGVTISNLMKHYYKTRFVGARRYFN